MIKEKVRSRVRIDSKNQLRIKREISQLFLPVRFILMKSISIMTTLEESCFVLSVCYLNPGIMILDRSNLWKDASLNCSKVFKIFFRRLRLRDNCWKTRNKTLSSEETTAKVKSYPLLRSSKLKSMKRSKSFRTISLCFFNSWNKKERKC